VYLRKRSRTINCHYGSALKLWNTCRRSLTQRLVSWCSPVVPKVWVETQTRVAKGQKWVTPRWAEAELCIFNVTTACLCSVHTWGKSRLLTLKNDWTTYCEKSSIQSSFFHTLFEVWDLNREVSPNSDLGRAQKSLGTADLAILALEVEAFTGVTNLFEIASYFLCTD